MNTVFGTVFAHNSFDHSEKVSSTSGALGAKMTVSELRTQLGTGPGRKIIS